MTYSKSKANEALNAEENRSNEAMKRLMLMKI
jgi:hypothetical protein